MTDPVTTTSSMSLEPIGVVHSCYGEKFGIPRQPGLAPSARSRIEVLPPYDRDEAFRGIEDFSHLWIIFAFHANGRTHWVPTVRPPRLGGNRRLGVFATRSPFRPNPLGLSAVRFEGLRREGKKLYLELSGGDFLDGTPVLDIKPYIPYADRQDEATGGFAQQAPETRLEVRWSEEATRSLEGLARNDALALKKLVQESLGLDPRPAYIRDDREFACLLDGWNLRWRIDDQGVQVLCCSEKIATGNILTKKVGQIN